jgi:hypothetical protein
MDEFIYGMTNKSRVEANFIPFEVFKKEGMIPRRGHRQGFRHPLTGQPNRNLCRPRSSFNAKVTIFIFVSHRWLMPGGVEGHPDDKDGSKFLLIIEAVERLLMSKPMNADECEVALWIDFGCIDQDLENPAEELNELHEIIAQCDVLLTPVHDPGHAEWKYPDPGWSDFYKEYKAEAFQTYWSRAWCAVEAMSAACMPVVPSANERGALFREGGAMWAAVTQDRRPHVVFGTSELVTKATPLFFPPLLHSNLVKYDPAKMELTSEKDRGAIERIACGLRQHIKVLEVGWKGPLNAKGQMHGMGTYVFEGGAVYEGECQNGEMHGWGTYKSTNGDWYQGEYRNGLKSGRGTYRFASGEVYEGEYQDGVYHGIGTYKYVSGEVYEGEWRGGDKNGRGRFTFASGNVYEGQWKDDTKNGTGRMRYVSGAVYEGGYKDGEMHGMGKYTFANGSGYEGEYQFNKMHGSGTFKYADGDMYEGEYKDDLQHGLGKFTHASGAVYEGGWKDGKMHGAGKLSYEGGDTYEGEWKDGEKEDGVARYTFASGSVYEGEWKDGDYHGRGTFTFKSGAMYDGEWRKGKKNGRGVYRYADGEVEDGMWRDDEFVG